MTLMLLTGIFQPIFASILGATFFVGRLLFWGYLGNKGFLNIFRLLGAIVSDIAIFGSFGGAVNTALKFFH